MTKKRWWFGAWLGLTALHASALAIGLKGKSELPVLILGVAISNALLVSAARFVARLLTDAYSTQPTHTCTECHGQVRAVARGNIIVEIGLWMLFLVPGIVYSYWRFSGPRTCPRCGGKAVPLESSDAGRFAVGGGA